jgi:beta-lactamase regulating signal transducer with metallopeptidase domain
MMQEFSNHYSMEWINVLSNYLLHSIWLAAIFVFIFIYIDRLPKTRRSIALQYTYLKLFFSSFIFLLVSILLFFKNPFQFIFEGLNYQFDSRSISFIVGLFWIVGALFLCLKYIGSQLYLFRIKKSATIQIPEEINLIFLQLKKKFEISNRVSLLASEKVPSAFVMGLIEPIIVMPLAWINKLELQETKSILLHELTHILNKDHIWNVILSCYQILFYFNPSIIYLVNRMKLLRELIADQKVVDTMDNKLVYSKLLIELEERKIHSQYPVLAFSDTGEELSTRIKTLFNIKHRVPKKNNIGKISISVLLLILLGLGGFIQREKKHPISFQLDLKSGFEICVNHPRQITKELRHLNTKSDILESSEIEDSIEIEVKDDYLDNEELYSINQVNSNRSIDYSQQIIHEKKITIQEQFVVVTDSLQETKLVISENSILINTESKKTMAPQSNEVN